MNTVFLFVLAFAVVWDTAFRRVPNKLVLPAIVFLLSIAFVNSFNCGVEKILGAASMGILWMSLWATNIIGGGDHKLLILAGSFLGVSNVLIASFLVIIFGGLIVLLNCFFTFFKLGRKKNFFIILRESNIAYSQAVFCGTVYFCLVMKT